MRLFVAGYPPHAALAHLDATVGGLAVSRAADRSINARVVPAARRHVTVAFIGAVPQRRVAAVSRTLARSIAHWQGAGGRPPVLRFGGGGSFGRRRSTVVWVGLAGDTATLIHLAGTVRVGLGRARIPCDRAEFRPHLTIARPGDRLPAGEVAADVAALDGYTGPAWTLR